MKTWKKSVLGAAMASALVAGGAGVPAQAAEVVSAGGGTLGSRGTTVSGTYTVDCDFEGQKIAASINVIQNTRGGTVNSNGIQYEFVCPSDGEVTQEFLVFADERGYVPGPATIRVGVFYSDESGNYTGVEDIEAFDVRLRNSR